MKALESLGGRHTKSRRGHRYLLVRFLAKDPLSALAIEEAVFGSVEQMFGKFGAAEMKLRVIGLGSVSDHVVLRCSLESVEKLRAALAMISFANQQPAAAMVIRSSGTIRGLGVHTHQRKR
jgi:RNase P/RNase MRP subunit POP5